MKRAYLRASQKENPGPRPVQARVAAGPIPTGYQSNVHALQRVLGNRTVGRLLRTGVIQARLGVGQPNYRYEREADQVAEQVMSTAKPGHLPVNSARDQVTGAADERAEPGPKLVAQQVSTPTLSTPAGPPPIGYEVLRSPGQPLDRDTRTFMESRFGRDFGQVRVHADAQSAGSARAVDALTYAEGHHLVFAAGYYQPQTRAGLLLEAHELAHAAQEGTSAQVHLQRQATPESTAANLDDPNFLICLALCELGIPPSWWRTAANLFLEAVCEDYRARLGAVRGSQTYQRWHAAFRAYSLFEKLKTFLVFTAEGKMGIVPIRGAAARRIRARLIAFLIRRGATQAGIAAAAQIVCKVAFFIEAAYAAGCLAYCGARAYVNALNEFSTAVVQALDLLRPVGHAITSISEEIFARPVLVVRAMMDPANWNTDALPFPGALALVLVGNKLWAELEPDNPDRFLVNITRPMRSFSIRSNVIQEIAASVTYSAQARYPLHITFTPDLIQGLTPLTFVELLQDWQLLTFIQDPERVADATLSRSATP